MVGGGGGGGSGGGHHTAVVDETGMNGLGTFSSSVVGSGNGGSGGRRGWRSREESGMSTGPWTQVYVFRRGLFVEEYRFGQVAVKRRSEWGV